MTMHATTGQKPVFSDRPGFWERHLERKARHPQLFSADMTIDQTMVDAARLRDQQEQQDLRADFVKLLNEMAGLGDSADTEIVLGLKERIDRLYMQCAGLGGDHGKERQALMRLHDVVMTAIIKAAGSDPLARDELEMEQAAHALHLQLLEYPVVADLLRTDSPVAADELAPVLLSETENSLRVVLGLFDSTQLLAICAQTRELLDSIAMQGDDPPPYGARLRLMEDALQAMDTGPGGTVLS